VQKRNSLVKYRCQETREWREYICYNELFTYLFFYLFVCLVSYVTFVLLLKSTQRVMESNGSEIRL
jgi:hypothetical protein